MSIHRLGRHFVQEFRCPRCGHSHFAVGREVVLFWLYHTVRYLPFYYRTRDEAQRAVYRINAGYPGVSSLPTECQP